MRLRDALQLLAEHGPSLTIDHPRQSSPNGAFFVPGRKAVTAALDALSALPALNGTATAIASLPVVLHSHGETFVGEEHVLTDLKIKLGELASMVRTMEPTIRAAVGQPLGTTVISIKLPPNVKSLSDLRRFVSKLTLSFEAPARNLGLDVPTIAGFDTGSSWLETILHSENAVRFFWGLVGCASQVVIAHYGKKSSQEDLAEQMSKEVREQVAAEVEKHIDAKIRIAAEEAARSVKLDATNEQVNVVVAAIQAIRSLQDDGTEFRLAAPAANSIPEPEVQQVRRAQEVVLLEQRKAQELAEKNPTAAKSDTEVSEPDAEDNAEDNDESEATK